MNYHNHYCLAFLFFISLCGKSRPASGRILSYVGQGLRIGLPIGLATAATFDGIQKFKRHNEYLHRYLTPVSPRVEAWAQRTLAGTKGEAASIRVMDTGEPLDTPLSSCNPHTIILDPDVEKYLYSFDDRLLDSRGALFTFLLVHEKAHLYYQDISYKKLLACMAMGYLTVFTAAHARNYMRAKPQRVPSTLRGKALFVMASFCSGIGRFVMGTLAGSGMHVVWKRRKEARADRFACEFIRSPEVLRGAADYFEDLFGHEMLHALPRIYKSDGTYDQEAMIARFKAWSPLAQRALIRWTGWISDVQHPHYLDRAKQLRAAAARIESQAAAVPK